MALPDLFFQPVDSLPEKRSQGGIRSSCCGAMGEPFFFRGADAVVFQTEEERDYFGKAIQKKSLVIPNPVMNGIPKPYEGQRKKWIVNFCRLEPQKNLPLLLQAFRVVCDVTEEYRLTIFGNGSQREYLNGLIKELRLESQAELVPFSVL